MYHTLKLTHTSANKVFFVSDLHYGHDRDFIYKTRGYNSVEEHDRNIIEKWNAVVTANDIVLNLGDIIFGHDAYPRLMGLINRLNFKEMYLSGGNHLSGFESLIRLTENSRGIYNHHDIKKVIVMPNIYNMSVNKQMIVGCHFPLASWEGMGGRGSWHVCGHEHGKYTPSRPETKDEGKILDVGIELFGRPIDFDELTRVMNTKAKKDVGHH